MSVLVERLAGAVPAEESTPDAVARAVLSEFAAILDESFQQYADATKLPGWRDGEFHCSDGCLTCFRDWIREQVAR